MYSTADTTIDTIAAGVAALAALTGVGAILTPALLAAIAAGAKAIADHASGTIDAATMMSRITAGDAAQDKRNADAAAYEKTQLGG